MKVELCQNPETRKIHKDVPGQNSLISENQPFWIWSTIWYQSTKVDTKQSQKDDKKITPFGEDSKLIETFLNMMDSVQFDSDALQIIQNWGKKVFFSN